MAFYSIYKIIKDIIRTLFGNKFLKFFIVIVIFFTIFFMLGEKGVFAYSSQSLTTVTLNNTEYNMDLDYLTSQYNYYILIWSILPSGSRYFTYLDLFCSNDEMTFYNSNNSTRIDAKEGSNFINFSVIRTNSTSSFDNAVSTWNSNVFNPSLGSYSYSSGSGLSVRQTVTSSLGISNPNITLANYDIKDQNNNIIFNNNVFKNPTLSNSLSDLENLNFSNFIINANSYTEEIENNDEPLVMLFYNRSLSNSSNTDGLYPIKEKYFYKESIYFDSTNSTDTNYIFNYPIFKTGVFFNIGSTYEIKLAKRVYIEEYNTWGYDYFDNSYVFTVSSNVTQDYINQLNQQTATSTDEDNQQQINNALNEQTNAINNQTQSIDNINTSITDSAVDNSSINLPTDNTNDPTQSGVDNIFQTIYNSFTSGTAQDIVFPIPFSNNNLVIQANYVSNMLGSTQRRGRYYFTYSSILLVFNQSFYNY